MGCSGSRDQIKNTDQTRVVAIVGGPGCGKGTQCAYIKEKHKLIHLSTGDLLRKRPKTGDDEADKKMSGGNLVSSDIVVNLIKSEFEKDKSKTYLLDGFPRNQENLNVWNKIISNTAKIDFMLFLKTSDEKMIERLKHRAKQNENTAENRADDSDEAIQNKRISVFKNETMPIVEKFIKDKKCYVINGDMDKDKVSHEIEKILKTKRVGAYAK